MDFTEAEKRVKEYRVLLRMHNASTDLREREHLQKEAQRLRDQWREQTGEDTLHELAFGAAE